jgi:hypothetical protein
MWKSSMRTTRLHPVEAAYFWGFPPTLDFSRKKTALLVNNGIFPYSTAFSWSQLIFLTEN